MHWSEICLDLPLPLTVIYLPHRWCGFEYRLFQSILGQNQYYPEGAPAIPENRLFAQFHAPQTSQMKVQLLQQMFSKIAVRVVFPTVAIGMGVDVPNIRHVIHVCPPCSVKQYFQETGTQQKVVFLFQEKKTCFKNVFLKTRNFELGRIVRKNF